MMCYYIRFIHNRDLAYRYLCDGRTYVQLRPYRYLCGDPGASSVSPALPGGVPRTCRVLVDGVRLNGHEYSQGSTCAYVPRVNRRVRNVHYEGRYANRMSTTTLRCRQNTLNQASRQPYRCIHRNNRCRHRNLVVYNMIFLITTT